MSWPSDGKPRFVLVETVGKLGLSMRVTKFEHRTVAILDRAWCHRCVFKVRTEDLAKARSYDPTAEARRLGQEQLAALNAEAVA